MVDRIAVIGGSGLYQLESFDSVSSDKPVTPYGDVSAELVLGNWNSLPVAFLPRHGNNHQIAPHKINYRANLWALHKAGVSHIIAVNAVGGITSRMAPAVLALPHQLIDYSHGREHTFGNDQGEVRHIDFSEPYSAGLRSLIVKSARMQEIDLIDHAVYGCTNGPRFETAAEIERMNRDGCDLVGMTGMPEAALARELGIEYASISLVVNWAAGRVEQAIEMEAIMKILATGMESVKQLILKSLSEIENELL